MTEDSLRRRPIKVRDTALARQISSWLAKRGITPNQISLASLAYAALGGLAIGVIGLGDWGGRPALYLICALMIELRLLCNLLDGMVAVEAGKGTQAGELFNEVPDRFADVFILVGAGYSLASVYGVVLGFVAALLAVLTAYVRALGSSMGLPADFSGPMAKPQRMHTLAIACVIATAASAEGLDHWVIWIALAVIAAGTGFTVARRLKHAYDGLMHKP